MNTPRMPVSRNKNRAMYPLVIFSIFHEAMHDRTQMKVERMTSGNDSPSTPTLYLMLKAGIQSASCLSWTMPLVEPSRAPLSHA